MVCPAVKLEFDDWRLKLVRVCDVTELAKAMECTVSLGITRYVGQQDGAAGAPAAK